jgi:ribosomal protein S18 acetylase RimI-like enzyme
VDAVRGIFREYATGLGVDLAFQDFERELEELPGKYSRPRGCVLLARADGRVIGCIAMRPVDETVCEMKRLYVRPEARGLRLGRRLADSICAAAREAGYARIRLDTLPTMARAQEMYVSMGFRPIPAYVFNPVQGTKYMELDLKAWRGTPRARD